LARHQYGNFVIQHLLEHGSYARRALVLERLLPCLPYLSTHRTASHVVQQAMNHSSTQGQRKIVDSLLHAAAPHMLVQVASSRYGSYVIEELRNIFGTEGPGREVEALLEEALQELALSKEVLQERFPVFTRVAGKYGLLAEMGATVQGVRGVSVGSHGEE